VSLHRDAKQETHFETRKSKHRRRLQARQEEARREEIELSGGPQDLTGSIPGLIRRTGSDDQKQADAEAEATQQLAELDQLKRCVVGTFAGHICGAHLRNKKLCLHPFDTPACHGRAQTGREQARAAAEELERQTKAAADVLAAQRKCDQDAKDAEAARAAAAAAARAAAAATGVPVPPVVPVVASRVHLGVAVPATPGDWLSDAACEARIKAWEAFDLEFQKLKQTFYKPPPSLFLKKEADVFPVEMRTALPFLKKVVDRLRNLLNKLTAEFGKRRRETGSQLRAQIQQDIHQPDDEQNPGYNFHENLTAIFTEARGAGRHYWVFALGVFIDKVFDPQSDMGKMGAELYANAALATRWGYTFAELFVDFPEVEELVLGKLHKECPFTRGKPMPDPPGAKAAEDGRGRCALLAAVLTSPSSLTPATECWVQYDAKNRQDLSSESIHFLVKKRLHADQTNPGKKQDGCRSFDELPAHLQPSAAMQYTPVETRFSFEATGGIQLVRPRGLERAWAWLAKVLNIDPATVEGAEWNVFLLPSVLKAFVQLGGFEMGKAYKKQFQKLLQLFKTRVGQYKDRWPQVVPRESARFAEGEGEIDTVAAFVESTRKVAVLAAMTSAMASRQPQQRPQLIMQAMQRCAALYRELHGERARQTQVADNGEWIVADDGVLQAIGQCQALIEIGAVSA
jgi:hypothetical protein